MIQRFATYLACACLLTACSTWNDYVVNPVFGTSDVASSEEPTENASNAKDTARDEENDKDDDDRFSVLVGNSSLQVDAEAGSTPAEIPTKTRNAAWLNRAVASRYGNIAIKGLEEVNSVSIGNGDSFAQGLAPKPVIATDQIIAMDGSGAISAHDIADIDTTLWLNEDGVEEDEPELLGGGLSIDGDTVFATTGFGKLLAINRITGETLWQTSAGAPIRGAPDSAGGLVIVLTADNQTIAYNSATGTPVWQHRGIQESAGFFSTTSPVITQGLVMVAYSSGELFALRLETGRPVWVDSVSSNNPTSALSGFSGVNADPMVQDGVTYTIGAASGMIANATLNGRPLWQQNVASNVTPWGAGNMLFVLSSQHELAGLLKRNGSVQFKINLAEQDDLGRDATPRLFAPIVLNGAVCVANEEGRLRCYDIETQKKLADEALASGIATPLVAAKGSFFFLTQNGRLYQYGHDE